MAWLTLVEVGRKLGRSPETVRGWVKKIEKANAQGRKLSSKVPPLVVRRSFGTNTKILVSLESVEAWMQWITLKQAATKLSCSVDTVRKWIGDIERANNEDRPLPPSTPALVFRRQSEAPNAPILISDESVQAWIESTSVTPQARPLNTPIENRRFKVGEPYKPRHISM